SRSASPQCAIGSRPLFLESLEKKSVSDERTIRKRLPMMFLAPLSNGAGGAAYQKKSGLLDRVSPRLPAESFEKTGHIQAHFIDTTPREDETPAEASRSRLGGTRDAAAGVPASRGI